MCLGIYTIPMNISHIWIIILLSVSTQFLLCHGFRNYENVTKIFNDKLGPSSGYNTAVRPLKNQSSIMETLVTFQIIAIVEIDAITQKFLINAFLGMYWTDELIAWDPKDYGDIDMIHPYPKDIWRPRMIISNTLVARDLFEDDYSPIQVKQDGFVGWFPGSLFPVSCKLDLYKYPFDVQNCYIEFMSMGLSGKMLTYNPPNPPEIGKDFYVESGEWTIVKTLINTYSIDNANDEGLAAIKMNFEIRRLPGFFIINIVIPIVLMSFLNILVFIIPVDSGEKISYGITVLLALTVFMSIVSSQLPRSSDTLPLVTIYLLVLTVISVCTVIVSILIVYFHFKEEKEQTRQRASANYKSIFNKFKLMNRTVDNLTHVKPVDNDKENNTKNEEKNRTKETNDSNKLKRIMTSKNFDSFSSMERSSEPVVKECDNDKLVNKWRLIGRHLDCISFIVFMVLWASVTIAFLVEIAK